jgi:hypothetical protein
MPFPPGVISALTLILIPLTAFAQEAPAAPPAIPVPSFTRPLWLEMFMTAALIGLTIFVVGRGSKRA